MGTESGPKDPGLKRELLKQFLGDTVAESHKYFEFDFFQAVRLLCRVNGTVPPGKFGAPATEAVHFGSHHDPGFPANQIRSLTWPDQRSDHTYPPAEMKVSFMGLTGPAGVLPRVYTEHVRSLSVGGDEATADFFDIFNHRAISLFYQAWEVYRFFVPFERDQQDRLSQHLMDLTGIGTPGLEKRQLIPDQGVLFFSGLLSLLPRSALALEQVLSDWFAVRVIVMQFQGAWHRLRDPDRCQFADPPTRSEELGVGVVLGDAVYDRGSRARIVLGPLGVDRYQAFLPGGRDHEPLRAFVAFFSNGGLDFDVQLILKREEVPEFTIGMGRIPMRLGWTTWMNARLQRQHDPSDSCFILA
jgi:type VI secretion system protein ImpH